MTRNTPITIEMVKRELRDMEWSDTDLALLDDTRPLGGTLSRLYDYAICDLESANLPVMARWMQCRWNRAQRVYESFAGR